MKKTILNSSKKNRNVSINILVISTICILILITILQYNFTHNNQKMMNLSEILEFNIKLYLISNAGLIDLNQKGSKILQTISNDEIMINFYRRLSKKYNRMLKHILLLMIITILF